jgi:hypothetical protein
MRSLLVLLTAAAFALPATSLAQEPRQDSVSLSGALVIPGFVSVTSLVATSGPSGENPAGQVVLTVFGSGGEQLVSGPVTCLAVDEIPAAVLNFQDPVVGVVTIFVLDGRLDPRGQQPDIFLAGTIGRAPTDCSQPDPNTLFGGPLSDTDITVIDAVPPPLPISKEQCKNGGWRSYAVFKNQGDCVSFVATGGKNPPANSP